MERNIADFIDFYMDLRDTLANSIYSFTCSRKDRLSCLYGASRRALRESDYDSMTPSKQVQGWLLKIIEMITPMLCCKPQCFKPRAMPWYLCVDCLRQWVIHVLAICELKRIVKAVGRP